MKGGTFTIRADPQTIIQNFHNMQAFLRKRPATRTGQEGQGCKPHAHPAIITANKTIAS
ncbi:hypothetical protein KLER11_gp78 [Pararheinheimera phage vB_PsoM_KLER1-1]|nr:hypothetical protein KLER11_gp78 [Pararheinheimera phage vB_PsoM_KLER1-1]